MNAIFVSSIKLLDKKFNRHLWTEDEDLSDSIIHAIFEKSWQVITHSEANRIYWDMYLHSAWGENITPHELIEKLSIISSNMKKNMQHSFKQCLRRVAGAVWKRITFREQRKIIMLILSDIIHRLKYKFSR